MCNAVMWPGTRVQLSGVRKIELIILSKEKKQNNALERFELTNLL